MALWGDYHTHTVYSHGKGTVEENVLAAAKLGLKEIAVTDHGFKHMTYNVRRMDWPFIRRDVERMKRKYPMMRIYLGIESNFNSLSGNIDILPTDMRYLEVVVCGYHKYVKPARLKDVFQFYLPNFVLDTLHKSTRKMTAKNTDAYIKALEKYEIDVISHINYGITVDVRAVAEAAKFYGTYIELNGKRINMTDRELESVADIGAEFICNSDAHSPGRVGDVSIPLETVERVGIPYSQIANWDRLPAFRSRRETRAGGAT